MNWWSVQNDACVGMKDEHIRHPTFTDKLRFIQIIFKDSVHNIHNKYTLTHCKKQAVNVA